ncbi:MULTISPECIES: ImmA/IrrE family metallo-endopeptidase [Roseovarius]|uniref:ImmA/IrrE family metallo-endopeptidase n=1 Tax=Roseovarius TaxID=74030 RepID=UPI00273D928A|nr:MULTISPECIES: ImmA/IrrE family metallo-endopeptidase [unclassified Roseovarius]
MKSLRDLFAKLPADGNVLNALRQFNLAPAKLGKAASVRELAERLGLDVHQVDLPNGMAGRLVSDPFSDSGFAIEVNKRHSVLSRRFTVLHEIGHFLLHADRMDPLADAMLLSRGDDEFYFNQGQEREANAVADVLLFGDGAIEAAASLHRGDLDALSKHFGVTRNMISVAMKKFGVN